VNSKACRMMSSRDARVTDACTHSAKIESTTWLGVAGCKLQSDTANLPRS
jgi:hypothetical protein